jgi:hypothetical protein
MTSSSRDVPSVLPCPVRTHPPEAITAQQHELVAWRKLKCSNVWLAAAAGLQGEARWHSCPKTSQMKDMSKAV